MAKNKHVDLFKEIIPSVDLNIKDLWDATTDEGRKEIKADLWNLARYISGVKSNSRELQEHFVLAVNEQYNKNWLDIQKHSKLQWQSLCTCSANTGKTYYHEYIAFNKGKTNKLENDFSKHKNFLKENCSGTWIFNLDADEKIEEETFKKIKTFLKTQNLEKIDSIVFHNQNMLPFVYQ